MPAEYCLNSVSHSDEWATPPELFAALAALYGPFDVDVAAAGWNAKSARWISAAEDGLEAAWVGRAWCNPPYSRGQLELWTRKARVEVLHGDAQLACLLVPGHTAEGWWHRHVEAPAGAVLGTTFAPGGILGPRTQVRYESLTVETTRLRGRVRFVEESGATGPARFASAVVVLARPGVLPILGEGHPVRPGRPRVIDTAASDAVRALLEKGHSVSNACRLAGVNRRTWYRHAGRASHG